MCVVEPGFFELRKTSIYSREMNTWLNDPFSYHCNTVAAAACICLVAGMMISEVAGSLP